MINTERKITLPNVLLNQDGEVFPQLPIGERILIEALKYEGAPVVKHQLDNEGMDPERGFDCSGFVTRVLQDASISIPKGIRHAHEYHDLFPGVFVHIAKPGDLIFYSRKGIAPSHIGFTIDNAWFIHASPKFNTEVKIERWLTEPPKHTGKVVNYDRNPIGIIRIIEEDMVPGRRYKL
jgi:cell wall-associated NlpC family hydrolase